jgi:hypothetical protein
MQCDCGLLRRNRATGNFIGKENAGNRDTYVA